MIITKFQIIFINQNQTNNNRNKLFNKMEKFINNKSKKAKKVQ